MAPDPEGTSQARTVQDNRLQVHELEHSVRALTIENHELRVSSAEMKATLDQVYGSRGWRILERVRGLVRKRS